MLHRSNSSIASNYHSLHSLDDLDDASDTPDDPPETRDPIHGKEEELTTKHALCLYLSHFLSMFNSRAFEFGVVLFIQRAFPGTLLPMSIIGIAETVCVLLFSSALGRWVDREPSRVRTLLSTIVVNRIAVLVCCSVWFLILSSDNATHKRWLFGLILALGMVEKSSRSANILSMERDWIPAIASPRADAAYNLTYLNTIIRRIDVLCKFLAPLAISTFIAVVAPIKVAVAVVALSSLLSVFPECWCIHVVWKGNSQIRTPKDLSEASISHHRQPRTRPPVVTAIRAVNASVRSHAESIRFFFSTPVWIPSLCAAVMHGSVLTWSGTLITHLLNAGFPLGVITLAKAIGQLFEIGSTFVFPRAVSFLSSKASSSLLSSKAFPRTEAEDALLETNEDMDRGRDKNDDTDVKGENVDTGVVRAGLFGIFSMFPNLVPVLISLFYLDATLPNSSSPSTEHAPSPLKSHLFPTIVLVAFLGLALLGRWTYDLAATQLAQTLIPPSHRSNFGGTEMVMVGCFSLGHWVAAAVWHQQQQFRWLALGSFVAVSCAVVTYGVWVVRWERGLAKRKGEGDVGQWMVGEM